MKCKNLLLFSFAAYVGVLFTSCSSSDNSSVFMKRKYTDLPVVKNHVSPEPLQHTSSPEPEIVFSNEIETRQPELIPDENVVASASDEPVIAKRTGLNLNAPAPDHAKSVVVRENKKEKPSFREIRREIKKARREAPSTEAEVNQVVLVILAIFIPPLAVYLKDGIGSSFWISLILTLLFWIPGVIYALLVVLDVI